MKLLDVTRKVEVGVPVGDVLTITRCVCREREPFWIAPGEPKPCPKCGRRFIWRGNIRVYRVMG